jgi:hypothetical protein
MNGLGLVVSVAYFVIAMLVVAAGRLIAVFCEPDDLSRPEEAPEGEPGARRARLYRTSLWMQIVGGAMILLGAVFVLALR